MFLGAASASGLPSIGTTHRSEFVEVAGCASRFDVKTSSLPSGETSKSAPPPTEKAGESKSPGVRSRSGAFASARSRTSTWVRLPSSQASQWRKRRRSATCAFIFPFSMASSFFRLQAASAPQSGHTSAVRTRRLPSGVKRKAPTPPGTSVFFSASPPAGRQEEDLGVARPRGQEREHRPVRREGGARVALVGDGQRAGVLAVGVDAPDVRLPLDRGEIGRGHREGDAPAVGRQRGLGDALHAVEVGDRGGARLGRARGEGKGRGREERGRKGEPSVHHGHLPVTASS